MIKTYIKIAWRNLWKYRGFSIINIIGLSIGIVFTALIGAYIWGEHRVNAELKDADQQYIILSKWKSPNMGLEFGSVAQLSRALKLNYPDLIVNYYNSSPASTVVSNQSIYSREQIQIGDSTMLTMYGFKLAYGDARTAFRDPYTVVVTARAAKKYFGYQNVVGKTLSFEDFSGKKKDFMITGVLAPYTENSITTADGYSEVNFFLNQYASKYFNRDIDGWNNRTVVVHLLLNRKANPDVVTSIIKDMITKNAPKEISENLTPYLMPLKIYHLQANNGLVNKMMKTLSWIAVFLMCMAIINFINIYIGRSSGRMMEIGVRKVLGSTKTQLVTQFLTEAIIMSAIAMLVSLLLYPLVAPFFGHLLKTKITGLFSFPLYFGLIPFLATLIIGIGAGLYPALLLSGLSSLDSFKGTLKTIEDTVFFRKLLIGFQFVTAMIVFISAIIIAKQINLFFNSDLGYNKDYVVYAQAPRDWTPKGVAKMENIKTLFLRDPQIKNVTLSREIPANMDWQIATSVYRQGKDPAQAFSIQHLTVDNQFAATYRIPLKSGSFFKPIVNENDSTQAVINELALNQLGWRTPDQAIGQHIIFLNESYQITGVVSNFHFGSLQGDIQPMFFTNVNYANNYRYLSFKLNNTNINDGIKSLIKNWHELLPGEPFEWNFMDDALKIVYKNEIQLEHATLLATLLSFIIVVLGTLGLIALSLQKRMKEIAIRKILGSPVWRIVLLFLKEFISIAALASLVACPIAYWLMNNWLNAYSYQVAISLSPFLAATFTLLLVTTILITLQTARASMVNPVKSFRTE
ncbi:MAG: hypothetical protein JWR50_1330 [Mucilaginibacter sp.]|nr:hypothetical protein [Mucilaginibacter sp.]